MQNRVTYDRVLMLDLNPLPTFNYVSAVSFANSGMSEVELRDSKFTKEFRLTARELPIYDQPRVYYIVAKVESNVDYVEELRATTAINDFVRELRKGGIRLDRIVEEVVENFKARVQKRVPYVRRDERDDNPPPKQTRRKRPIVTSSDPDDRVPLRTLGVRSNPVVGPIAAGALPQNDIPPVVTKKPKVNAKKNTKPKDTKRTVTNQPASLPACSSPLLTQPPAIPLPLTQPPQHTAFSSQFTQPQPPQRAVGQNTWGANDHRQAIVLATAENPIIMDQNFTSVDASSPIVADSPAISKKVRKTDITKLIERVDAFDRKLEKRNQKVSDTLKYLIKKTENVAKDVSEIRVRLQSFGGQAIAAEIESEARFPLQSPEDLVAYMEEEPSLKRAIAR